MGYNSILLLFLLQSISTLAQLPVVFTEDFDNNKRLWLTVDNESNKTSVERGVFYWSHKQDNPLMIHLKSNLIPEMDFVIEAKFKFISGNEYGLSWGMKDAENVNNFTIKGDLFRIGEVRNSNWKYLKDYTRSSAITKSVNILKIEKRANKLNFFINDKKVAVGDFKGFFGNKIGFLVWGKTTFEVDYLYLKQRRDDIHLPPDFNFVGQPERLSKNINTPNDELIPIISPDGNTLYYAGRGYTNNMGSPKDDIYFSNLNERGEWSKGENIGSPLNNADYNYVSSVSPDGNTLLVSNAYNSDGTLSKGVSISHRTLTGWSFPEPLKIKNYYNNSSKNENCLSSDGKVVLLTLTRTGGRGENDIYVSFKEGESWTEPRNLGKNINTSAEELSPFLSADGVTLFFASRGHAGYGEADIFVSKRLDDSWTNWTDPHNLGPKINTENFEAYFTVPASGKYAYFVQSTDAKLDIFRQILPMELRPEPVILISGRVLDRKTGKALNASIIYEAIMDSIPNQSQETLARDPSNGIAISNPTNGAYKIVLPHGRYYAYRASAPGYMEISENINLDSLGEYKEINKDLYLVPIEVGQSVTLNNVFFEQSESTLLASSYAELDRLVKFLKENHSISIELGGHTDNQGNAQLNLKLSEERVNVVKSYLVQKGISIKRLKGRGYGGEKPLARNDSEESRKHNRRVEFTIINK